MPQAITGSHNLVASQGPLISLPGDTIVAPPLLLPLADNGGPTLTHALSATSPAVDTGSNPQPTPYDQRGPGHAREVSAAPDIGAFELQGSVPGGSVTVAVPVFSTWAGMLLAALLAGLGLRLVRRRL